MTAKEQKFCDEYLIDLNATQAAKRAGYSVKTACAIGAENLRKPHIENYVNERRMQLAAKTEVTQIWVLNRFKEISDRCMLTGKQFDPTAANRATEMLAKHLGFFEQDNQQSSTVIRIVRDENV